MPSAADSNIMENHSTFHPRENLAKDLTALKATFVRPGFVEEWNNLDHAAKEFNKQLTGKDAATPSATWKLFMSADPQAVLYSGSNCQDASIRVRSSTRRLSKAFASHPVMSFPRAGAFAIACA